MHSYGYLIDHRQKSLLSSTSRESYFSTMDLRIDPNMKNCGDLKSYNDLSDDSDVRTGNNLNNAKICSNLRKLQIEENFGIQREFDSDPDRSRAEDDCDGDNSSSSYDSEDMLHEPCEGQYSVNAKLFQNIIGLSLSLSKVTIFVDSAMSGTVVTHG